VNKWWLIGGALLLLMILVRKLGFLLFRLKNKGANMHPITLYNGKQILRECDSGGCGHFGASRNRAGGSGTHKGQDIRCTPGATVYAPFAGTISRLSVPYADDSRFSGVVLEVNPALIVKIMYMQPKSGIVGQTVEPGDTLGTCQNISLKYGTAVPAHLHVEVHEFQLGVWVKVDPAPYLFNPQA
jgi:murein DD-endopeptidase MepM/ murein hydrolase activator NlpD